MHLANLDVEYADNKDNSNKDNKQRKRGTGDYVKEERPEQSYEHSDEEVSENFDRPSYGGANTYKKKRQQSHFSNYATEEYVWNLATGEAEDILTPLRLLLLLIPSLRKLSRRKKSKKGRVKFLIRMH